MSDLALTRPLHGLDGERRHLSDRAAVGLAVAAWAGAVVSLPVPLEVAVVVVAAAFLVRRPMLLVLGAGLLSAALGARAEAGLDPPPPSRVDREVTVLSDPVDVRGAVRVDVRVGGRRVEAWARGAPAASLRPVLAGERVGLVGRLRPPPESVRARLARRHVVARLDVESVGSVRTGSLASRAANGLRRTLAAGADPLGPERRALFTGMVIGDDRAQPVEVADDFRGAGLTHLLAVSGQNVAFVLALAGPGLRRLRLPVRWVATLAVLAGFGLVTRFEPSVLRASAMAAVACTVSGLGRSAPRVRVLALAVTAVVLVDPLIVGSLGFMLSVGATLGIVLAAAPLRGLLPGPRPVADALAVTLAAQLGVAPVLVLFFGGLPVAALPANLLAVPAAAPVMAWGLTAGLVAGVAGPPVDALLHLPTAWLLAWVAGVAREAAAAPLGVLGAGHLTAMAAAIGVGLLAHSRPLVRRGTAGVLGLVLVLPSLTAPGPHAATEVATGASLYRKQAVVLVIDDPSAVRLLDGLRSADVRRIDVLVSRRGSRPVAETVRLLRSRMPVRLVLAPQGHRIRDAAVPALGTSVVGGLRVAVQATTPHLQVEVSAVGAGEPRERPG